ncbi:hypothetical protein QE408_000724 [Agrobacterium larrymoorei]|uniref:GcrA cell cycle regulator n=1 Tax=Agrobacterium larrymoorei TaxID=160699 RepID=A0ABU0UF73_9HYPH|nr:hypothetical protein [Agrobacterium larrymoorei]
MIEEKRGDGTHVNHFCSNPGCTKWGSLGYSQSKIDAPQWWCWEHYPYKQAPS